MSAGRVGDEGVEVGEGGGMANADIEVARKAGERRRVGGKAGRRQAARSVKLYIVVYELRSNRRDTM